MILTSHVLLLSRYFVLSPPRPNCNPGEMNRLKKTKIATNITNFNMKLRFTTLSTNNKKQCLGVK